MAPVEDFIRFEACGCHSVVTILLDFSIVKVSFPWVRKGLGIDRVFGVGLIQSNFCAALQVCTKRADTVRSLCRVFLGKQVQQLDCMIGEISIVAS